MSLGVMLHAFFSDGKVYAAAIAIVLDLILGVLAAWKAGNFRLSYVSDFLRNDVAFKLFPYFLLYAGALVAGNSQILIPGLDLGDVAMGAYVIVMGAWVGSIAASLAQLGLGTNVPQDIKVAVAGSENASPPKD